MSIYNDVLQIEDAINDVLLGDENGNVNMDVLDTLTAAKSATIEWGLENLCKIRANKLATIDALRAESARLMDRAKTEEKRVVSLENYIHSLLNMSGHKKIDAGTFSVSTRISQSVYVAPTFDVPEFIRTTTTTAPDKIAIRDALKSGREIPGAQLTTRENIVIK